MGVKVIQCNSDEEARQGMAACSRENTYPVYFFKSDTSGEKLYEEFYSENDTLEVDKFNGLGVIENKLKPSGKNIQRYISSLKTLMINPEYTKESIIVLMRQFIPDFNHMETGKNLDQKM